MIGDVLRWCGLESAEDGAVALSFAIEAVGTQAFAAALSVPTALFGVANRLIEPLVRRAGSRLAPLGVELIVVEVPDRRRRRIPLVGIILAEDHVLVGTGRGVRSAWVRRLQRTPHVRYWREGKPRHAFATVFPAQSSPISTRTMIVTTFISPPPGAISTARGQRDF